MFKVESGNWKVEFGKWKVESGNWKFRLCKNQQISFRSSLFQKAWRRVAADKIAFVHIKTDTI